MVVLKIFWCMHSKNICVSYRTHSGAMVKSWNRLTRIIGGWSNTTMNSIKFNLGNPQ